MIRRCLTALVLIASVGAAPGAPATAAPTINNYRTSMTWSILEQQDGYVRVGADGQTNPYTGDTTVIMYHPALCLNVDYQPAPAGHSFDFYSGWARGRVRATAPVRGDALAASAVAGDILCANTFGAGWKLAEFHDGRYGSEFELPGGWSFWAAGSLFAGERFWVAISDQPANAWNSAGTLPGHLPLPQNDLILKTRMNEIVTPLLHVAADTNLQVLARNAAGRMFDGDSNVLMSDFIAEAEASFLVDPGDPSWVAFKNGVAGFANVNGESYAPQIFIPNYEDGVVPSGQITMAVYESDLSRDDLPAYILENGQVRLADFTVNEAYAETHEVWVLAINEPVSTDGGETVAATPVKAEPVKVEPKPESKQEKVDSTLDRGMGVDQLCNPTGLRNNRGNEYMQKFKVPSPSSVEHWTAGKLEPRMIVVAKNGVELKNAYFGKIKRKTVKNWVWKDLFLVSWDRALWGDYFAYKWLEMDGGPAITLSLGFGDLIKTLLGVPIGLDLKAVWDKKFDDMGSGVVSFTDSTYIEYSTGTAYWTTCSWGGDGGTGFDNYALGALTAASTTYPGYSPAKVNDGDRSTALGGGSSWANNSGVWPPTQPQWVQLDFGVNRTFRRIVVYTTATYAISDFDIQYWNGVTWVTPAGGVVTGNTAAQVTVTIPATTSRLVRVLGRQGPAHQPGFVRVNEFEVYAS